MKKAVAFLTTLLLSIAFCVQAFAGTAENNLVAQNEAMKLTLVQAAAQNAAVTASTMQQEKDQAIIAQVARNQAMADLAALQSAQQALDAQLRIASTPAGNTPEQASIVAAAQKAVASLSLKAAASAANAEEQEDLLNVIAVQTAMQQMDTDLATKAAISAQAASTGRAAMAAAIAP
ncbi:MAG: hypothetical protein K5985_03315 [Lachnospiraceae bacterium]|nr:hypothetical protein [Lachnospiraceae bacterium]